MFGVTLRTNFKICARLTTITPARNINRSRRSHFAALGGGESVNAVEIQRRLADPQIQAKGDTLYVTGEQVNIVIRAKGSSVLIGS